MQTSYWKKRKNPRHRHSAWTAAHIKGFCNSPIRLSIPKTLDNGGHRATLSMGHVGESTSVPMMHLEKHGVKDSVGQFMHSPDPSQDTKKKEKQKSELNQPLTGMEITESMHISFGESVIFVFYNISSSFSHCGRRAINFAFIIFEIQYRLLGCWCLQIKKQGKMINEYRMTRPLNNGALFTAILTQQFHKKTTEISHWTEWMPCVKRDIPIGIHASYLL